MSHITTPAVEGLLCRGAPVVLYNGRNDIVQEVGALRAQLAEWGYPVEYENLTLRLDDPDGVGLLVALRYLHLQNRPLEWARYLPLEVAAPVVQAHLALIAAGGEGIRGLAGEWREEGGVLVRFSAIPCQERIILATVYGKGWYVLSHWKNGSNTGEKGQKSADKALLSVGYALLDGGTVRVPTPPAHQPA